MADTVKIGAGDGFQFTRLLLNLARHSLKLLGRTKPALLKPHVQWSATLQLGSPASFCLAWALGTIVLTYSR